MNITVRDFTREDVPIMVAVGKQMHEESAFAPISWDNEPEYRSTQAAVKLINAYIEFGKSKGCREVNMQIATNVHPEKTGELLKNLNFTSVGGTYVHSVT